MKISTLVPECHEFNVQKWITYRLFEYKFIFITYVQRLESNENKIRTYRVVYVSRITLILLIIADNNHN